MRLKELQEEIKKFVKGNNLKHPIKDGVLDLISEVGEFSKEILKAGNYGKKSIKTNKEIKLEIGDIFYSLITIANYFNIDLDEALQIVLKKYKNRLKRSGSLDSKND